MMVRRLRPGRRIARRVAPLGLLPSEWSRAEADLAAAERALDAARAAAHACPACSRMAVVAAECPKLTLDQVDAIVQRQIALGRCAAHSYADATE